MNALRTIAVLVATSLPATAALAADGALEIHQACVADGCFPGDGPGFPVEITEEGSYVLTSNLQVPDEHTTAIDSLVTSVHLDLGGFVISGVTQCVAGTCAPIGNGTGVAIIGTVRNGTVRGMGRTGINASEGLIEDVVSARNGLHGIVIGNGVVRDSVAFGNHGAGILSESSEVVDCVARDNGATGINAFSGLIRSSVVRSNGLRLDSAGVVVTVGTAEGNLIYSNRGPGLDLFAGSAAYGNNQLWNNNQAIGPMVDNQVVGGGVQLGPNLCQGAPCP